MDKMMKWLPVIALEAAGFQVLTIPKLKKMLDDKSDDAIVCFLNWHSNDGSVLFPTDLKIIDLSNYNISFKHAVGSGGIITNTKKTKMVMFNIDGLPKYERVYLGDKKPKKVGELSNYLTVLDFKSKISSLGKNDFFGVTHYNNFVSPDLLMNYNIETYKLKDKSGNIIGSDMKNGDIVCFGLGTTMSSEWGNTTISLIPKKQKNESVNKMGYILSEIIDDKKVKIISTSR